MEKHEMIYLASKCRAKNWNYEELYYGDDLYGHEKDAEAVWKYVIELEDMGKIAFYDKYKEFKLY